MTEPGAPDNRPRGVPIRELREDARTLSPEDFEDRHGSAFLLLSAADLAMARGPMHTEVQLEIDGPPRADSTASLSLLVFPVRHSGHSAGHLITVGRSSESDVVVPDVSVSRFHAFVKQGPNGEWLMHDAGSTNGTTVNGRSVAQQGAGSAAELKAGDNVRFGQVELTFLDTAALISFAGKMER